MLKHEQQIYIYALALKCFVLKLTAHSEGLVWTLHIINI